MKHKGNVLIIVLFSAVVLSGIFYLSFKQEIFKFGKSDDNTSSEYNLQKSEISKTTQISPTPNYDDIVNNYKKCIKSTPSVGHKYYISPGGWYFEYPTEASCETVQCMYEKYTISPSVVSRDQIKDTIEETLKESVIFCAADGPTGSISCKFNSYKEYSNPKNTKGYIIYQTKTDKHLTPDAENKWLDPATKLSESDWVTEVYNDRSYFFFIPNNDDPAIHLQVFKPTKTNLEVLDQIASSFTLISCK